MERCGCDPASDIFGNICKMCAIHQMSHCPTKLVLDAVQVVSCRIRSMLCMRPCRYETRKLFEECEWYLEDGSVLGPRVKVENAQHMDRLRTAMEVKNSFVPGVPWTEWGAWEFQAGRRDCATCHSA